MLNQPLNILRIDASARRDGSISRQLTDRYIDQVASQQSVKVTTRDLTEGLPFIDGNWIEATFTPVDDQTEAHLQTLAVSDSLVEEIQQADVVVIGTPIYNFGVPASLKAWVDMIARVGVTFKYGETGPVGLLQNKRAVILAASGGTAVNSEIDFAVPYLKHVLSFIGISDVEIVAADQLMIGGEEKLAVSHAQIKKLAA